jgi:hypothetical protein
MAEIYVPGAIDIMGSANQMMQFRNSQQAQQANALQMQYAAEDRARAEQGRRAAAGNALAERAALSKALENSVVGMAGPEQPNLGNAQNALAMQGRFGAASAISNVQEQFAKQQEQEAKAAGQGLTNVKTGVETEEKRADVTKKAIEIQRQSFDYAQDLPTLKALITASYTPGHPLSEFHAINGVTLDQALKSIDDLAAQGKTFEQIREQMSQGASKAADNIAARGLVTAQTDKVKGEAGGGGSGGTENERNRQLFAKAMQDPGYVNTPEYAALYNMSFGRKMVEVQDPNGPPGQMVNRIIDVPAPEGFPRPTFGQQPNTLAPATAAAQPTNALAMAGRYGSGTPAPTAQAPNLGVDMRTGENMVTKQPAVSAEREKQAIAKEIKIEGANTIIDANENVRKLLSEATSGGLEKMGADFYGFATGVGTSGAVAEGKLQTIAANLLFANLPNGSLGGQVSDGDRLTIDRLSGQIADSTLPANVRLGAWEEVVSIAEKYKDKKAPETTPAKTAASADETTQTYANAKEILAKINASSVSQEKKTELINQVNKRLIDNGLDPAKAK